MTPNRRTIAKCDTSWGEYRRRAGRGLFLYAPQGLVAPSVSLPMVGCHLPQEGRRRTRSVSPPLGGSTAAGGEGGFASVPHKAL